MRTLIALATITLAAAAWGTGPDNEPDFSFLEGAWVGTLGGSTLEEVWMPTRNGNMTGCLRSFDEKGELAMLELFTITTGDDGPVFRIRHFNGGMTPWESETDGPKVFGMESGEGRAKIIPVDEESSIEYGEFIGGDGTLEFHLVFKGERPPLEIRYRRP